jgi:hypothetical protein
MINTALALLAGGSPAPERSMRMELQQKKFGLTGKALKIIGVVLMPGLCAERNWYAGWKAK